jgi:hypothetical protein
VPVAISYNLVQHHPEREQVRAGIHLQRPDLLRRHVRGGSQRTPWACQAGDRRRGRRGVVSAATCTNLGQSEIENLRVAAPGDEQVGGLDVAVDNSGGMRCLERVGDLDGERQQSIDLEGLTADLMLQRRQGDSAVVRTQWRRT